MSCNMCDAPGSVAFTFTHPLVPSLAIAGAGEGKLASNYSRHIVPNVDCFFRLTFQV